MEKKHIKNSIRKAARKRTKETSRREWWGSLQGKLHGLKEYLGNKALSYARELFRICTSMNKLNFKGDGALTRNGLECMACGYKEEVNTHMMVCPGYQDLKVRKDIKVDSNLVEYFRQVMDRRIKWEAGGGR